MKNGNKNILSTWFLSALIALSAVGCGAGNGFDPSKAGYGGYGYLGMAAPLPRAYTTDALIFNGNGTAGPDAQSLADNLAAHGLTQKTVSSAEMNAMSLDDLSKFGMIVWPGGYATQMSNSLTRETRERIRLAVTERGVSFFGICAGAFIAVSPNTSWGLSIVPGAEMDYYYLENQGTDIAMTTIGFPTGAKRDILWYGGPKLPFSSGVIAKYPNGDGAMSEGWAGHGFVVLSAVHPEAPDVWFQQNGVKDADGRDDDIAFQLLDAALHQKPLPTY